VKEQGHLGLQKYVIGVIFIVNILLLFDSGL